MRYHPPFFDKERNKIYLQEPTLASLTVYDNVSTLTSVSGNTVVKDATIATMSSTVPNGLAFHKQLQTVANNFSDLTMHLFIDITTIPTPVGAGKCGFMFYVYDGTAGATPSKWSGIGLLKDSSGNYHRQTVSNGVALATSAFTAGKVPSKLHWDVPLQSNAVLRGGPFSSWEADDSTLTGAGIGAYQPFVGGFTSLGVAMCIIDENGESGTYEGAFRYAILQKPTIVPPGL